MESSRVAYAADLLVKGDEASSLETGHAPSNAAEASRARRSLYISEMFSSDELLLDDPIPHQHADRFVAGKSFFNYAGFGSLRDGLEPIVLFSRSYNGLAVNAAAAGFCLTFLRYGFRPLLTAYLSMHHPAQFRSAKYLLDWPGSFSVFIGLVSDCYPLWGFRRKSYMVLGWILSLVMFIGIVLLDFFGETVINWHPDDTSSSSSGNWSASTDSQTHPWGLGAMYVFFTFMACCALQITWVVSLALLIGLAQREHLYTRGHLVALYFIIYYSIATIVQAVITQLLLPTADGGMASTITITQAGLLLVAGTILPLPFLYYNLDEERVIPDVNHFHNIGYHMKQLWQFGQQKVVHRVIFYLGGVIFVTGIYNQNVRDALTTWVGITDTKTLTVELVKSSMTLIAMVQWKLMCVNANWKVMAVIAALLYVGCFVVQSIPIAYDWCRAEWFYMLLAGLIEISKGWLKLYVVVTPTEMALIGHEGANIGLVLSFQVLWTVAAHTVSLAMSEVIGTNVTMDQVIADSVQTRHSVLVAAMTYYAFNLTSLLIIFWLPASKLEAQLMRTYGGYNKLAGYAVAILFFLLTLYNLAANVVKMLE